MLIRFRGYLGQVTDPCSDAAPARGTPEYFHFAVRCAEASCEDTQCGGFAGTFRSEQAKDFAAANIEGDVYQSAHETEIFKVSSDVPHGCDDVGP